MVTIRPSQEVRKFSIISSLTTVFGVFVLIQITIVLLFFTKDFRTQLSVSWSWKASSYTQRLMPQLPNITSSQWIEYFPVLKKMATYYEGMDTFPPLEESTSATNSNFNYVSRPEEIQVGNHLEAIISARNYRNESKTYGGDFFRAVLYRKTYPVYGVSCEVQDNLNGTYVVTCPLLWVGDARLVVMLIHPSESLFILMKNSSGAHELGVSLRATVNDSKTGEQEIVECSFSFLGEYSTSQVCNHSNPRNGEPWFCLRTRSGACPPIVWMDRYYDDPLNEQTLGHQPYFTAKVNWRVRIQGPLKSIDIRPKVGGLKPPTATCTGLTNAVIPTDPAASTGWSECGIWRSSLCKNRRYDGQFFATCLKNHVVYLIGDSTIRHWYNFLIASFGAHDVGSDGPDIWAQARNGYQSKNNLTLHYRAHGPPLHNPGTINVRPYISDTLDSIGSNVTHTVVLFTIGLHMDLFHPDLYLHRIRGIKKAAVRLISRSPEVRVFVRGHHVHSQTTRVCPSDWFSYRHDVLLRHIFKNLEHITYIPMWDMTSLHNNAPYHPKDDILNIEIGLFQSLLCSYQ